MHDNPPNLPPPAFANPLESLRDRSEMTARTLCIVIGIFLLVALICAGGIGLFILFFGLISWILGFLMAAQLKGGAVQINERSWPELHAVFEQAKTRLGMPDAKAYVIQDNAFNAFAARLGGRNFVVLNSGAVDTLLRKGKIEDLKFLVGHECGHVALGHVGFWGGTAARLASFIYPLHAWHRRCQERSADRCGLWCAGNRADAHRSIAVLAGGSEMGSRLDILTAATQWSEIRDETWIMIARYYSEYPHTMERILLVHQAADELRIP